MAVYRRCTIVEAAPLRPPDSPLNPRISTSSLAHGVHIIDLSQSFRCSRGRGLSRPP